MNIVENKNHEQHVTLNVTNPSRKSIDKAKQTIVNYLRDVKAPKGKRSMGHLMDTFCNEGGRFPRLTLSYAVLELIFENRLIHSRDQGVTGGEHDLMGLLRCNDKDWIIYNQYPNPKKNGPQLSWADPDRPSSYCKDSPYPCVDKQILCESVEGKYTKGTRRVIVDFDT
jgi:hypothetical protein